MTVPGEGFSELTGQSDAWVDTGLAMALSLGKGFLEPAGPQSQRNTLRVCKMSCYSPFPAKFVKRSNLLRLIVQNPLPSTEAAMLLLPYRYHWSLPALFRGQWNQPKLLLAVWETFLPPLIVSALFIARGSNTATTSWPNLPKPTRLLSCWPYLSSRKDALKLSPLPPPCHSPMKGRASSRSSLIVRRRKMLKQSGSLMLSPVTKKEVWEACRTSVK